MKAIENLSLSLAIMEQDYLMLLLLLLVRKEYAKLS